MNKNKYILLGAVVLGLGLTSCSDFLNVDRYFRDQQSTERIFSDKDYTLQWLSFCYSRLQGDNLDRKSTRLNSSHDRQSRMPSSA